MKVKYIVNKEKGVVVCVATGTELDLWKDLHILFEDNPLVNRVDSDYLFLPDTFKGVARLSPDDVWDEQIGKSVAYTKMKKKYLKAKLKGVNHCGKVVAPVLAYLANEFRHLEGKIEECDNRLNEIC